MLRYRTIGLDLDDTIADHSGNFLRYAHENYGLTDLTLRDIAADKHDEILGAEGRHALATLVYGEASLSVPPVEGSVETVRKLLEEGADAYIISHRHAPSNEFAMQWISANLPFFSAERVLFTEESAGKDIVCKELGIEIFLDNKTKVLKKLPEDIRRVLFDPFDVVPDSAFERVHSWSAFYQLTQK